MIDPKRLENAILVAVAQTRSDDWLPCTIGDLRNRMLPIDAEAANAEVNGLVGAIGALATKQLLLLRKWTDSPGAIAFDVLRQHDEKYIYLFFSRGGFELKLTQSGKSRAFESASKSPLAVGGAGEGSSAASAPKTAKIAPPSLAITFGMSSVPLGGTTTLTFVITNSNLSGRMTGIAFDNNLPAGLVVSKSPRVTNSCGGTVRAKAGSSNIILSGGSLGPGVSGRIMVNVLGVNAGMKVNNVEITSLEGGDGNRASNVLNVVAPPIITKAFEPQTVVVGETTRLTFTITNPNLETDLTGIGFNDVLPPGLMVSDPNGLVGSWGEGKVTAATGGDRVSLSGASVARGSFLRFQLFVLGVSLGIKNNSTSKVTSSEGGNGNTASQSVLVEARGSGTSAFREAAFARSTGHDISAHTSNTISEVTRRSIIDYLSLSENWSGRFSDVEFLARLYDLNKLPSTDSRFKTAYEDILQHTVNNPGDWQPDWVFTDSRFNLLHGSDANFLRFLCETIHPVVRSHSGEAHNMAAQYNLHLAADGWEIVEEKQISGKSVFAARRMGGSSTGTDQQPDGPRINTAAVPEIGVGKPAQSPLAFDYTDRCTRVLVAAAGYTRNAREPGEYTLRSSSILYALIDFALQGKLEADDAAAVLGAAMRGVGVERYREQRRNYFKKGLPYVPPVTVFDGEPLEPAFKSLSPSSHVLLVGAMEVARRTGVEYPRSPLQVDTRHLVAASMTILPEHLGGLPYVYSALALDMRSLATELYSFLIEHYSSRDRLDQWPEALGIPPLEVFRLVESAADKVKKESPAQKPLLQPGKPRLPGHTSDSVPNKGQLLADELGIAEDVKTLSSVLLAREVNPPLAVGLFGDWGTGKSYFMEKMYWEIDSLARRAAAAQKTAYHSKVVQIRFNAWHYVDSSLWASLASHIFDELSKSVCPEEDPEETKRKIMLQLESARQMRVDAEAEQQRAQEEKKSAEDSLESARAERERKQVDLANLRMPDLLDVLGGPQQRELKAELIGVLESLGLPSALNTVQELNEVYRQAFTLVGRSQAAILSLWRSKNRKMLIILLIAAFLVVPLISWLIEHLLHAPGTATVTALVGDISLAVGGFATAVKKRMASVSNFLTQLEAKRNQVLGVVESKRREVSRKELEFQQELEKLQANEDAARERVLSADAKVRELEQKLEDIKSGRSLSKFLLERVQGEDYRKHLGIMSLVRRDFEKLNDLLTKGEEGLDEVGRIILYVDDLDRCPADKVVEVLQAVHLLLGMPIFVAVVGVDLRWLLHSLDQQYTAFHERQRVEPRTEVGTSRVDYQSAKLPREDFSNTLYPQRDG